MFDAQKQRQELLSRLKYYNEVFGQRSEEYKKFKITISIPRIHLALARLTEGTYGYCDGCSEYIGDKRLELIPAALYCLDCQNQHEKELKARHK